jgi:formylglycine-generating enzyme required for sulfatase activity
VRAFAAALVAVFGTAVAADGNPYLKVEGARLQSALPVGKQQFVPVHGFRLQQHPVTNAEYLAFTQAQPQWSRDRISPLFADAGYLSHWQSAGAPGAAVSVDQPVTRVSWFAAEAYCDAQQARLPTWYEWELAAAASGTQRDARSDPQWRQEILDWYSRPSSAAPGRIEQSAPNLYGLYDLHGLVWEWVQDFNSLLPADADPQQFCGSGAQNIQQKDNYAVLMRVAMLGSLHAVDTGHSLGFRCAMDLPGRSP